MDNYSFYFVRFFSGNLQQLRKSIAFAFLKNRNHRRKREDDYNISEECQENTCDYEEVNEWIHYNHLNLNVASFLNIFLSVNLRNNAQLWTTDQFIYTIVIFKKLLHEFELIHIYQN